MKDAELLDKSQKELDKALAENKVNIAKSYALDSIAASLLVIARNSVPITVTSDEKPLTPDDVELIVRRLSDGKKNVKSAK